MKLGRLARAVSRLSLGQIWAQATQRWRPTEVQTGASPKELTFSHWWAPNASTLDGDTFRFGRLSYDLPSDGPWLPDRPAPFFYALNYLDFLRSPDVALERKLALWDRWAAANPIGATPPWQPFCVSCRLVNLVRLQSLAPEHPGLADAIATHAESVLANLEVRLRANHYLINGKALAIAGRAVQHPRAEAWRRAGDGIVSGELTEQFLPDGAHFERSGMYHRLVTYDLLELFDVAPDVSADLRGVAEKALGFASFFRLCDDRFPMFNDAALGIGPKMDHLLAYADALGLTPSDPPVVADHAGFGILRGGHWSVAFDFGPLGPRYQPGHGHADTLCVEAAFDGEPLLVDPGTGTYAITDERSFERSTRAHNTPAREGVSSSEVWSSFRVGREAEVSGVQTSEHRLQAAHDGYGGHTRRTVTVQDAALVIVDEIPTGTFECRWIVAEGWDVEFLGDSRARLSKGRHDVTLEVENAQLSQPEPCSYHERFFEPLQGTALTWKATGEARVATRFEPDA